MRPWSRIIFLLIVQNMELPNCYRSFCLERFYIHKNHNPSQTKKCQNLLVGISTMDVLFEFILNNITNGFVKPVNQFD